MFCYRSTQALVVVALFSSLATVNALVRIARAAPGDVVDLEGDTHHNPPASTTDKSTPQPAAATNSENTAAKDTKERREAAKDKAAQAQLKLRAGERVGNDARGMAQVLGMGLQEGTHARVKVVDVAMNSPAFDAGVMKGDEIVAFQGFRGESYRKWIDGIRRLTTDTAPGLKIPVTIVRDGKQLTVGIEIQEKPVRPSSPRTLAQPGSPLIQPGVAPMPTPAGATGAPVAISGGNNVALENGGPFGEFFGGEAVSPNERAMAQIVRIGGQASPNAGAAQKPTPGAATAPINGGAHIGMAGFRDEPSGMVVMVDVGALPPGNYIVGITDPGVIGGGAVTGAAVVNPNIQAPSLSPAESGAAVATNTSQPIGQAGPSNTAAIGEVNPASRPATGEVNPASKTPTGKPSVSNVQSPQNANGGQKSNAGVGGSLSQIGTITVDQRGTGRMQQKVESVQVRTIVGQAIVIYSQGGPQQKTLPANLNGNAGGATRQGAVDSPTADDSQASTATDGNQGTAASRTAALEQTTTGTQVPVAGGIIQLISDRRPPAATAAPTSQVPAGENGAIEQPASATAPLDQQKRVR